MTLLLYLEVGDSFLPAEGPASVTVTLSGAEDTDQYCFPGFYRLIDLSRKKHILTQRVTSR